MNHSRSMGRNHPFQFSIEEERAQCRCPLYRVVQQDLTPKGYMFEKGFHLTRFFSSTHRKSREESESPCKVPIPAFPPKAIHTSLNSVMGGKKASWVGREGTRFPLPQQSFRSLILHSGEEIRKGRALKVTLNLHSGEKTNLYDIM